MALLTVLNGYMAMQGIWGKEAEKYSRIVVMNTQGFSGPVPIAYLDRIRSVPGVEAATPYAWYGGNYKEERMPLSPFGTDPQKVFRVLGEFSLHPQQLPALSKKRNRCLVGPRPAGGAPWKG